MKVQKRHYLTELLDEMDDLSKYLNLISLAKNSETIKREIDQSKKVNSIISKETDALQREVNK